MVLPSFASDATFESFGGAAAVRDTAVIDAVDASGMVLERFFFY